MAAYDTIDNCDIFLKNRKIETIFLHFKRDTQIYNKKGYLVGCC
jgi:hypothetical protein